MHSQTTLETMKSYRISRVLRPWENMKPPIQGGVYHVLGKGEEDEDEEEALPDTASNIANDDEQVSDNLSGTAADTKSVRSFAKQVTYEDLVSEQDAMLGSVDNALNFANKVSGFNGIDARAEYVATAVQKEIEFDTARYPSLDPDTQRDIAVKFQALHQRVKDEDFYQCRFIEYGKEMVRYKALFALFCLRLEPRLVHDVGVLPWPLLAPDHVHCARRRSSRHFKEHHH